MPTIKLGEYSFYFEAYGSGEPLLLIAGLRSDSSSWLGVAKELSAKFRTVIFDNRGCGRSDVPSGPYSISDMAGDAVKLLDALEIEQANVIGHSMGGYVAQELAIHHPGHVNNLVLESTSFISSRRNNTLFERFLDQLQRGCDFESWVRMWASWLFSPKTLKNKEFIGAFVKSAVEYPFRQPPEGFGGQVAAIASFDARGRTCLINARTLVIEGKDDALIVPREAEALAENIRGSDYRVLKEIGHCIHIEDPGLFIGEVAEFLRPGCPAPKNSATWS
jgi:pimeloyl-ACP methyl ester carboxylesterase